MGRKSRNTSVELRELAIAHFNAGKSYRDIGKLLNKSHSTIQSIIKRFKTENQVRDKPKPGPSFILNERDNRWIVRKIRENPRLSAPKLSAAFEQHSGKKVCAETIRRVLRRAGYNGRVARKKPLLTEKNRKARLAFAEKYVTKDPEFWNEVIFADESKFNVFGSDGRVMVWRKPNTEVDKKNILPTVKHGGASALVWGCMSAHGTGNLQVIEGIMDKRAYLDILKKNLKASAEKMGLLDRFKFYQDNDPKHKSYLVQEWLLDNCPKVLQTPAQSPDCNPIENLWHELAVRLRRHTISNKQLLISKLHEEWAKIPPNYTRKLVESMPKRLRDIINRRGLHTKY